jgi:hypothetical protein
MDEDRQDEVSRELRNFNTPPSPPLNEMWTVIEDTHFNASKSISQPRGFLMRAPWLAAAATLLLGIGIGHYLPFGRRNSAPSSASSASIASTAPIATDTSAMADAYRDQTSRYLGQTAALLISLPAKSGTTRTDAVFAGKAADLLVTTRLLMDSPAASDPKLRALLDDLELVLVQIARLRGERNKSDLDLIHQTVEQGDVLSRLNSAVVTNQSAE